MEYDSDLQHLLDRNGERLRRLREIQGELSELTGQGRDEGGVVTATVNAQSGLVGLHIDPRAMRLPSEDLSERVLAAVEAAGVDLRGRIEQVLREGLGDDIGTLDSLLDPRSMEKTFAAVQESTQQSFDQILDEARRLQSQMLGIKPQR